MGQVFLAIDHGGARIGVAISRSGMIAEPLVVVENRGRKSVLDALEKLVGEHAVTDVVVGVPLRADRTETPQSERARAFARSLRRRLPRVAIHFQDEHLSSAEAADMASGSRAANMAGSLDRLAAAIILRDFLAARSAPLRPPSS